MKLPKIRRFFQEIAKRPLPGKPGVTLGRFIALFRGSLSEGQVRTRSSAIAFQALLAAPPALFFLFTLLPYLPVEDLEQEFILLLGRMVPQLTFQAIEPFVRSLFQGRGAAPFIGLVISLFIASNGVDNVIDAFHATAHEVESRPFLRRRLVSLLLVVAIALITAVAIVLTVLGRLFSRRIAVAVTGSRGLPTVAPELGSWIVVVLLVYAAISLIYFYAPAEHPRWRAVSIGAITATLFVLVASWGFSLFLRHVAQLNRLFGSLGTLMALMIWLKLVALAVLIGFELNVSLEEAGPEA
jgi:membrane protein